MTDKNASQTQQTTNTTKVNNPFAAFQMPGFQMPEMFATMTKENVARFEQASAELQKMSDKNVAEAHKAVDEYARVMKESINYFQKLSNEWQKMALEQVKKSNDLMTPKA
ncbi:hypothetical protein L6R52_04315 [Myxococcota bacterium]|nr:hypothetical protein [Myxococcota bacterium]